MKIQLFFSTEPVIDMVVGREAKKDIKRR